MPGRGELLASAQQAPISREIKGINKKEIDGAGYCDEIVNNALMEIATGQSSCFQCLEAKVEGGDLESVT